MGNCCKRNISDGLKRKTTCEVPLWEQLEWQNLMIRNDLTSDCENICNAKELLKGDRGKLEDGEWNLVVHQNMFQQVKMEEEKCMLLRRGDLEMVQICLRKDREHLEEEKMIFTANQVDIHIKRKQEESLWKEKIELNQHCLRKDRFSTKEKIYGNKKVSSGEYQV